jgi:L-ascorbate metabolism protein UlaG (beta-lactamase superfamily)
MRMVKLLFFFAFGIIGLAALSSGQKKLQVDTVKTAGGNLAITFIGHGSLMFAWGGRIVHVDPYAAMTDYSKLPAADLILITHDHGDHLDPKALQHIRTPDTRVIIPKAATGKLEGGFTMNYGEADTVDSIRIEAVPAYNIVNKRPDGTPFHPRGTGNGYVLTFGDTRVYVAGDTENIPEMKALKNIDIAFLPVNLPYTMSPEMAADAARAFRPKILYPYHYGETDLSKLKDALGSERDIEIRIRDMK